MVNSSTLRSQKEGLNMRYGSPIDTLWIPYGYPMKSSSRIFVKMRRQCTLD